jgi:ABC-2 type transport system permease protein
LAEAFGDLAIRMVPLGLAGVGFAWALTGVVPPLRTLLVLIPLGLLAATVAMTFHFVVGLTAVWLHDSRPVYWVWQKGVFLLGGLLVPLQLYPDGLRTVAELSQFAAILHGPGGLVLGEDGATAWVIAARLAGWLVFALGLATCVYQRSTKSLDGAGG